MKKRWYILFLPLVLCLAACNSKKSEAVDEVEVHNPDAQNESVNSRRQKNRQRQYFLQGKDLYAQHCANCHQPDGSGLGALYPPLKDSDFLAGNESVVACGIKNGMMGPLMVNGVEYNQPMAGMAHLTNLQIAEIMTFVYTQMGGDERLIEVKTVDKYLAACEGTVEFE